MSDQTDSLDANVDTNASQAEASQGQTSETQAGNSLAGQALADLALKDPVAAEQLRRHYQSQKDKGVSEATKTAKAALDEVQKLAARLGVSPEKVEQVRKDMLIEEIYQERYGNSQPETGGKMVVEAQATASSNIDLDKVKKVFPNLDYGNDLAVMKAISNSKDMDSLFASLGRIAASQVDKPKPSPTQAVMPGGSQAMTSDKVGALNAAYQKDLEDLKQRNNGRVPATALSELKKQYREKGLSNLW